MKEDIYYLSAIDGVVSNNKLILVNMLFGMVLEYDLEKLTYTVIGNIRLPEKFDMVRVCSIIPYDEFFYLVLQNSEEILKFSKNTKEVSICGSPGKELRVKPINRSGAYLCGDVIWSLPWNCSADVMKYNVRTNCLEKWKSMGEILESETSYRKDSLVNSYLKDDQFIYMVIDGTDIVIVIDTDNEEFVLRHLGEQYRLRDIEKLGRNMSLTLYDSKFFLKFQPDCSAEEISYESIGIKNHFEVQKVFMDNDRYVAVMAREAVICLFEQNTGEFYEFDFSDGFHQIINKDRIYAKNLIWHENYLYYIPLSMNCFIRVDLDKLEGEKFSSEIRKRDVMRYYYMERMTSQNVFWIEHEDFNVSDYLDCIISSGQSTNTDRLCPKIGQIIYKQVNDN